MDYGRHTSHYGRHFSKQRLVVDLSAAFDTLNHNILLTPLCIVYGITGNALDWFRSDLIGSIQCVVIEDSVSIVHEMDFGVPQDSVFGTKIYCMYTKPVSDIIQRHGLSHHSYADDTQLYMTMDHINNDWRDWHVLNCVYLKLESGRTRIY